VLGELVAQGLVTADGFAGLRSLLSARSRSAEPGLPAKLLRRRAPLAGAGRWGLRRPPPEFEDRGSKVEDRKDGSAIRSTIHDPRSTTENWAWQLLRRWGVVFRDLLEREPGAPRWFELLQVYRRLEARGEIRGGRFITGVAGEQFAVGETVRVLRRIRDAGPAQELLVIAAADPLNLVGILTSHDRITSNASNRVAYLDGVPVASLVAGDLRWLVEPTVALRKRLSDGRALLRRRASAAGEAPAQRPSENSSATSDSLARSPRKRVRAPKSLFPRW
jgi:ATP-dependent Lhr-like helicase